jgi:hypothetical protein
MHTYTFDESVCVYFVMFGQYTICHFDEERFAAMYVNYLNGGGGSFPSHIFK